MTKINQCSLCRCKNLSIVIKTENFEILKCLDCKIAFTNPAPVLPDYENMDFHSKNDAENQNAITRFKDLPYDWQDVINRQIEIISTSFEQENDILEIGCGEGIFLDELLNRGYKNVEGFEPSINAAVRAQKKGLSVINQYFNESAISKKYDLVIMSHVFEHIAEPYDFLKSVKNVLKENGKLMLVQTNYLGLIPRLQKERWYAWVPEQHFWHFTPISIKNILEKAGFKNQRINFCSLVHPHNLLYNVAKLVGSFQDEFISLSGK